mmetsp:Transcript_11627/g.37287  ORF Transcript_11627/g.37287 Transcript_11627/m.37287 type:complete len:129 (-) Transcript_11627:665-1051(-)
MLGRKDRRALESPSPLPKVVAAMAVAHITVSAWAERALRWKLNFCRVAGMRLKHDGARPREELRDEHSIPGLLPRSNRHGCGPAPLRSRFNTDQPTRKASVFCFDLGEDLTGHLTPAFWRRAHAVSIW